MNTPSVASPSGTTVVYRIHNRWPQSGAVTVHARQFAADGRALDWRPPTWAATVDACLTHLAGQPWVSHVQTVAR